MPWRDRLLLAARCLAAGLCLCASVPPWGWWPLAFVGVALWDGLLAARPVWSRFRRTWLVAAAWLFPSLLWMWDLTPPGYVVACSAYAGYVGVAAMAVPPGRGRRLALPGAIVLAELARWSFPFGGVPLATLAMSQADTPLGQTARLGNALLVSGLVGVGGVALAAAVHRRWRPAAVGAGVVAGLVLVALVAPRGSAVDTFEAALVQGGGPQRTRAADTDERKVFERHLVASRQIEGPVDLVLWPENVVSVEDPLDEVDEGAELVALSEELGAPIVAGVTEGISDTEFLNYSVVVTPDGLGDVYEKVLRVPFGEYVPLRGLLERVAGGSGLPRRDARPGTEPAVLLVPLALEPPEVPMAIAISWEVFFTSRGADGVAAGGEVLLNPTNGSSYWLTQVQTQQVASSQLRAIESGRWVLQAAPTGFSAVVDADGALLQRSDISDPAVLQATVERRTGDTIATRVGQLPALLAAVAAIGAAWALATGRLGRPRGSTGDGRAGGHDPSPEGARTSPA